MGPPVRGARRARAQRARAMWLSRAGLVEAAVAYSVVADMYATAGDKSELVLVASAEVRRTAPARQGMRLGSEPRPSLPARKSPPHVSRLAQSSSSLNN